MAKMEINHSGKPCRCIVERALFLFLPRRQKSGSQELFSEMTLLDLEAKYGQTESGRPDISKLVFTATMKSFHWNQGLLFR